MRPDLQVLWIGILTLVLRRDLRERSAMSSRSERTAYVVICRDGPKGALVRAEHTADHMAYIETVLDELNIAGPLYDDGGQKPVGSLYCLATRSLARAREIIEKDPYFVHGAFASVDYFPHLPAAGKYIGGKIW
jgi:uncharacterized protein YciI